MTDLIILGNGMAGMTAALYAKRANLDFKIVGKDEFDFGQIGNAILVENYPCTENLSGFDLAMKLHDQLESNGVIIEEHEVNNIFKDSGNDGFVIEYVDGTVDTTKTIIYALGASHRKLNCEEIRGDVKFHYCALCDGPLYKEGSVAVIGGGDSAFTQAEYLSKICKGVTIIMCDQNITANSLLTNRVKENKKIAIVQDFPVTSIIQQPSGCYCLGSKGVRGFITASGIFVAIGMEPNISPIKFAHIYNNQGYILANERGVTPVQGFFAAGDVRVKSLRQSITAAADGANAVNSAIEYLRGRQ